MQQLLYFLETLFGWKREEVLGADIGVLMPDQVAVLHHSFMENYLIVCKLTLSAQDVKKTPSSTTCIDNNYAFNVVLHKLCVC